MASQKRIVTRRQFLLGASLALGSGLAAACAQPTPPPAAKPAQPTAAPAAKPTDAPRAAEPTKAPAAAAPTAAPASKYREAPMLTELVKAGKLPPVDQRLPANPVSLLGQR